MKSAKVVEINVNKSARIKRLDREYGNLHKEQLIDSINRLKGQISKERLTKAIYFIRDNKTTQAIEIVLDYYDRAYDFTKKRFRKNSLFSVNTESGSAKINSGLLLKALKRLNKN